MHINFPCFGNLIPKELQVFLQPLKDKNEFLENSVVPTTVQLDESLSPAGFLVFLTLIYASRDGASTISWGNMFQCSHQNLYLIPNLSQFSFSLKSLLCVLLLHTFVASPSPALLQPLQVLEGVIVSLIDTLGNIGCDFIVFKATETAFPCLNQQGFKTLR